ncbi:MAG: hypothetical protein Q7U70_04070 [Methylotenera sp.]|nr:hypothetical protein [Methylotenera sp.]MDO9390038.1 hypothetical protein [Methylotenera sp.]
MKKEIINVTPPQVTRIIKIATCTTCSGKATLTYHFGCNEDKQVYIRIVANSGGGFFSDEWIKLADIQVALDSAPFPVTSFPLIKLFIGKSVNTPGFLLAVLKHEGLVKLLEGKIRGYEKLDPATFMLELDKLVSSDVNLKAESVPVIKKISPTLPPKKSKLA